MIIDCTRLESLEELDLIVTNISLKTYRGRERYIVNSKSHIIFVYLTIG